MDMQDSLNGQEQIQNKLLTYSQQAGQQEKEKVEFKGSRIKEMFPNNYYQEMSIFFLNKAGYNPQFSYSTVIAQDVNQIHQEYYELANKILINNTYSHSKLPILSKEEVIDYINEYLAKIGLQDYVELNFTNECLSRTSVVYFKSRIVLKLREPLSYTRVSLQGTLNHQIGTHIVRYLNHKENSERKPTKKSKIFQQGLAAITQLLPEQKPILFKAALRYNAVIHASKQSFVQVYAYINKFIKDEIDCWRQTVRAKRGLMNTQRPGGYYKDQNYLIGAVDILINRKSIDFQKCFYSKLSAQQGKNIQKGVLPPFLDNEQKRQHFIKKIQAMSICNFIDSLQQQYQNRQNLNQINNQIKQF